MHSNGKAYQNLDNPNHGRESTAWHWRLIALIASWMILGGYLLLPSLYTKDPQLKFKETILLVFVVGLMTAGYSFTALLCFVCRNEMFQAEAIFLPALTSSAIGLLTIAYNFLSSRRYDWNTAAISGTAISCTSTLLYGFLLFWTHRRIVQLKDATGGSPRFFSEPSFYNNFIANAYPSALRSQNSDGSLPPSEDDLVNQKLAMLLHQSDSRPSPDCTSATFRIDMPVDREQMDRVANSSELVGTPPPPALTQPDWNRPRTGSGTRASLTEQQALGWWDGRGRSQSGRSVSRGTTRPVSSGARSGHSRAVSREERRREIELGFAQASV